MTDIYSFELETRKKGKVKLSDYKGKVMIIVNTATGCGFTPHYEPLENMYKKLHDKGLEIIDVPCNQFGNQAPGSDDEIHDFCVSKYKTSFEQFKKSDVNGPNELPLFKYLKEQQPFKGFTGEKAQMMDERFKKVNPDYAKSNDVKWNFTKFVVDKTGKVVARFEPTEDMKKLEECVETLLA